MFKYVSIGETREIKIPELEIDQRIDWEDRKRQGVYTISSMDVNISEKSARYISKQRVI